MKRDQKFFDMYSLVIGVLAAFALAIFVLAMKMSDLTQGVYTRDADEFQAAVEEPLAPRSFAELAALGRDLSLPIVLDESFTTTEMPYGTQVLWPDHCIIGSDGASFHADLDTRSADLVIRKGFRREIDSYSAFFENDHTTPTGLDGYLRSRGVDTVTLVGLATDFCVNFSAVDAARLGFHVTVIESLCRAIDLEGSLSAAQQGMKEAGVKLA